MNYKLRNYTIGFEVPFLEGIPNEDKITLTAEIADCYDNWFSVLGSKFWVQEIETMNPVVFFNLIVLVDTDMVQEIDKQWSKVTTDIESKLENYFKTKNEVYRVIHE